MQPTRKLNKKLLHLILYFTHFVLHDGQSEQTLASVLSNYAVSQSSLDTFADMAHQDMEMSTKVNVVAVQLGKFNFLFGVMLGEKLLRLADNLGCTLQHKDLSAAEGIQAGYLTCETS